MVWDLSDGRGLQNCPVRPCRLGVVSGGNEDHKQAPYPPPRPAHTAQAAANSGPGGRRPGGYRGAQTVPHERHTGHHGPFRRPECRPAPARRPRPASAHSGRLHRRQRAERAALSSRRTGRGRTPERRPINRVETRRRPAGCSPATRRAPPPPPARTGEALTAASRCRVARRLRWQQCSRRRRRVSPSGARPRV